MKPLTAREVERILRRNGFELARIHGSHHIWIRDGRAVPVPHHGNAPIKQGTLLAIFNGAGIPKPTR